DRPTTRAPRTAPVGGFLICSPIASISPSVEREAITDHPTFHSGRGRRSDPAPDAPAPHRRAPARSPARSPGLAVREPAGPPSTAEPGLDGGLPCRAVARC